MPGVNDPDLCPDCQRGRYDRNTGVVSLVDRCCCVYFYGEPYGSAIWREYVAAPKAQPVIVRVPQSRVAEGT